MWTISQDVEHFNIDYEWVADATELGNGESNRWPLLDPVAD